ncbi:hypothetical protein BN2476_90068 [Paraburkholderia piptadeniae]|uniref:Uncharacterized protein n=1 Tax=Paraburkholderia piptadeniae TaxID=1701573 RepID=A0A1N7RMY0_9BURK|nr:hypothetical protein BN2476_90068 [Paraburkholderia piptadeniae]
MRRNQPQVRLVSPQAVCVCPEKWLQSQSHWACGFMCGSGATTGNKMMGVSPIFFCRSVLTWVGISGSTNVRRLGAQPAGVSQRLAARTS